MYNCMVYMIHGFNDLSWPQNLIYAKFLQFFANLTSPMDYTWPQDFKKVDCYGGSLVPMLAIIVHQNAKFLLNFKNFKNIAKN